MPPQVADNGDIPCPNDGQHVNVRCWACGWIRPQPEEVQPDMKTTGNPLADSMAEAAMNDVAVPYSLVHDAWDLLERARGQIRALGGAVDRTAFEEALKLAVTAYEDRGGQNYRFNPRSLPVAV